MPVTVSVITPAYNAAATLGRAHASVANQTFSDWEHIIVDDGSTDETSRLLTDLAHDPCVRSISQTNSGQSSALNAGLRVAAGEFVAFLDADDEYLPAHLADHLAFLREHPAVDLLWGGLETVCNNPDDLMVPDVEKGSGFINIAECIVQGTIFGRRPVFQAFQFIEDRRVWWQDYEFVQRARQRFVVEQFPGVTYRYYRVSSASLVGQVKLKAEREGWKL